MTVGLKHKEMQVIPGTGYCKMRNVGGNYIWSLQKYLIEQRFNLEIFLLEEVCGANIFYLATTCINFGEIY